MKHQPTAMKVCHMKHWNSDTYDLKLLLSSSLITSYTVRIALPLSDAAVVPWTWSMLGSRMCKLLMPRFTGIHDAHRMCAFLCRYPEGQVWHLQFFMSWFLSRCNQLLLWELPVVKISPPCCLSLECSRNSLLWLGATCSTILCCDWVRHCLGRQEQT